MATPRSGGPGDVGVTGGEELGLATDEQGWLYNGRIRALMAGCLDADELAVVEAFSAVAQAARAMRWSMERWAARHGLSEARLTVLLLLRQRPDGMPLGELAGLLDVSPRTVTGLVDHLERDGLVSRVPAVSDRRSVLGRLTERGADLIDAIWPRRVERQMNITSGISAQQLAELRHLCLRLVANLRQASQAADERRSEGSAEPDGSPGSGGTPASPGGRAS